MSVSFLDPTLPGRIPSRFEVIDAQVTSPLEQLTVSLRFANGKWDVVYQDGIFGLEYRASTVDSSGLFHIRRASGWPADQVLQFRFKEGAAPSSTTWSVLYDVDLRTLPNQTIVGADEKNDYVQFTLGGQPWYWHGAAGKVNLVNGQGLVGSVTGDGFSGNPYAGFYVGLRVYAMAGYDPTKEVACQCLFSGAYGDLANDRKVGAAVWSGGETWGYGPGSTKDVVQLTAGSVRLYPWGQTRTLGVQVGGSNQLADFPLTIRAQPFAIGASWDLGRRNWRQGSFFRAEASPLTGGWVDPEGMIGLGSENGIGAGHAANYHMGFYAGSPSGSAPFTAIRLRVLQRAVP